MQILKLCMKAKQQLVHQGGNDKSIGMYAPFLFPILFRVLDSLARFSDLLDLSASGNASEVIFGFDTYALQLQDVDPDLFNGQTFTVNLGSVEDALQSNGNLGASLNTSEMVMNILVNHTTSSVKLPENFFTGSMNGSIENGSNSTNELRLSYTVFLTDILFQSPNQSSVDIGSIVVSTRLSSEIELNPIEVSFRTVNMVYTINKM